MTVRASIDHHDDPHDAPTSVGRVTDQSRWDMGELIATARTSDPAARPALGNPRPPTRYDAQGRKGAVVNLPNLITLGRILLVPVVVWAIASNEMQAAFVLFLLAGVSDAVDGFLAKRFHMKSELGAYLDPLADKVLIVSI